MSCDSLIIHELQRRFIYRSSQVRALVLNYILHDTLVVITQPCPNFNRFLLVKGDLGDVWSAFFCNPPSNLYIAQSMVYHMHKGESLITHFQSYIGPCCYLHPSKRHQTVHATIVLRLKVHISLRIRLSTCCNCIVIDQTFIFISMLYIFNLTIQTHTHTRKDTREFHSTSKDPYSLFWSLGPLGASWSTLTFVDTIEAYRSKRCINLIQHTFP